MAARYRLEALLKLKARDKKRAEIALAISIIALNKAKEKWEELKEEKKEIKVAEKKARKKMDEEMIGGGFIGKGCFHVNFLRKLKEDEIAKQEEIENQEEVVREATEKAAKCKRNYIEAAKQLQIMEKHKGLWAKKIRLEISRREEKEMDELGQTIHCLRA